MKKIIFLVFLLFFIFKAPVHALTSPQGWEIEKFNSDISVQSDGRVKTTETLNVNFHNLSKHGIFRDIPNIYASASGSVYTKVEIEDVSRNGNSEGYSISQNGSYLELKIGKADVTISGNQEYAITYYTTGVLREYADYDELYWNVTGNSWAVPIMSVNATISIPAERIEKIGCFEGPSGSTTQCNGTLINSRLVQFTSTRPFGAGEGMSAVIAYSKGLVPILTVDAPPQEETLTDNFQLPKFGYESFIAYILALAGGVAGVLYVWYKKSRDDRFVTSPLLGGGKKELSNPIGATDTIVVEYTPPEDLRPAQIGVIMDERADTLDVTATIIDLATRGYLTITEVDKKWVFGSTDYTLERKKKSTEGLHSYEALLLDKLFEDGDTVTVSELKTTFYSSLREVKNALYDDVIKKKYFDRNPESTRNFYTGIAVVGIIASFSMLFFGFFLPTGIIVSFGVGLILPSFILLLLARTMSKRTALGHELYRRIQGYELFISHVEKYRQQFFEKKNMFNVVLPYAIVFGLTEKFSAAMKDMGMMPKTSTWYYGSHGFSYMTFNSSMNSFSSSFGTAISSSPQSSGFSSGGGFSGGGFSGGGGGSW